MELQSAYFFWPNESKYGLVRMAKLSELSEVIQQNLSTFLHRQSLAVKKCKFKNQIRNQNRALFNTRI